jgi:diketogulonate reductase-like aldo/keto reductase
MVGKALEVGWRHFDSACDYGNEVAVGAGLAHGMKVAGVKREDIFVTSKLWNTFHHPDHVELACRKTLKDLNLDYLDLYLIHFPIPLKYVPVETRYPPEWTHEVGGVMEEPDEKYTLGQTWAAMERLVDLGLVRNIGVANFNAALLLEVSKTARIQPAVNQIELHPHLSQKRLVDFCQKRGVVVTGFSPLGSSGYVEIGMDRGQSVGLLQDPKIVAIAERHGKSPAQVLLRWGVQRGTAVIPKTSSAGRLRENLDIFDFELTAEDMDAIYALNRDMRYNDPGVFCKGMGGDYPIWD